MISDKSRRIGNNFSCFLFLRVPEEKTLTAIEKLAFVKPIQFDLDQCKLGDMNKPELFDLLFTEATVKVSSEIVAKEVIQSEIEPLGAEKSKAGNGLSDQFSEAIRIPKTINNMTGKLFINFIRSLIKV